MAIDWNDPRFLALSTEEQAKVKAAYDRIAMPTLDDAAIGNVVGHRRTGLEAGRVNDRLERALAAKQRGMAGLQGAMQPDAVPSRWGPILTKKSPIEKIIAALGVGVPAFKAAQSENDLTGLLNRQQGQEAQYQRDTRGANERANSDNLERILRALQAGKGTVPSPAPEFYDGEGY